MKKISFISCVLVAILFSVDVPVQAQSLKDKMKASKDKLAAKVPKKDRSESFKCGYIHKESLAEKANPMKALQKSIGGSVTQGTNSNFASAAISVFYQSHLHPQNIMKYPTNIPGWETCGDAVFAGFTNKSGTGLSSIDGGLLMSDEQNEEPIAIPYGGLGTYFWGFKPDSRVKKSVYIFNSKGESITVGIEPAAPLEIKTINGQTKGEDIVIDGTTDVVIELVNGDADPKSNLHVQMICKLMGTPIIYDVIVTKAKNTIYIPKEAFKNFEGSPSPFSKNNTLIVNRVTEKVINGTIAGALRTISAYMDWVPLTASGDLSKGNVLTMGFDTTKNTNISIQLKTSGEYTFKGSKEGPYKSPPVKLMSNVAIASFVVRGNLSDKSVTTGNGWKTTTTKWFPELDDDIWQALVERLYLEFSQQLKTDFKLNILPLKDVVNAEAYKHTKTIIDGATQNFVEVGAGGTKRILTTQSGDLFKDLSITFPGDFVSERLVKELGVDAVIAVTIDLDFNFESEGLNPRVKIEAYAPNVSYKTAAKYFTIQASTDAKSLSESKKYSGGAANQLYEMIKADALIQGFADALKQLSTQEDAYPVYEQLWKAKL